MRIGGIFLTCAAVSLFAAAAFAQSMGASTGMSGNTTTSMQPNARGGVSIFSREDMAMMIVDREKATKGMTAAQAAQARQEEMAHDRAETPDQRMARKQRYDAEWAQLTPVEQSDAMAKLDAQMKARAAAANGAMSQPAK